MTFNRQSHRWSEKTQEQSLKRGPPEAVPYIATFDTLLSVFTVTSHKTERSFFQLILFEIKNNMATVWLIFDFRTINYQEESGTKGRGR
jgi:hypothetical protein